MARPSKSRKVGDPPAMKGFKPYGMPVFDVEPVKLTFEEYESIRLVNYRMLSQDQAAEEMNVSRPTLTRVYNKALRVIAKALIEGKVLEIEGGNYIMERDWYRCKKCFKLIEGIENHVRCKNCTLYSDEELLRLNPIRTQ